MIASCDRAAVWLSTAAVFCIVDLEVCNCYATAVNEQVNRMYFVCASGAGEVCKYKIMCS